MAYLGENIQKLGFGLMRLPMLDGQIDIEQVKDMVDLFMCAGFTYFDTAYGYNSGASELAARDALIRRYPRDSFQFATKLPAWMGAKSAKDAEAMFWTSLERTQAQYFDFYLLHNIGDDRIEVFERFNMWNFIRARKEEGLIKHIGFSFHDKAHVLDRILTEHPEAEFVQLQLNYADWDSPSVESRKCYEVARKHGKPVVVMEPVKGGSLAILPDTIAEPMRLAQPDHSLASWAIRFAASLDGVITVLSGMSNLEQMRDNLATMRDFQKLDDAELDVLREVNERLARVDRVACTACGYCVKGCPMSLPIPGLINAYNNLVTFANPPLAKGNYAFQSRGGHTANTCVGCQQCESVCPQHLPIVQIMRDISARFD